MSKLSLVTTIPALPAGEDPAHPLFGQGGSYLFDPASNCTTLVQRSGMDAPEDPPIDSATAPLPDTHQE